MPFGEQIEFIDAKDSSHDNVDHPEQNLSSLQLQKDANHAFNEIVFSVAKLNVDVSGLTPEERRKWLQLEIEIAESPNDDSRANSLAKRKEQFPQLSEELDQLRSKLQHAEELQQQSVNTFQRENLQKYFGEDFARSISTREGAKLLRDMTEDSSFKFLPLIDFHKPQHGFFFIRTECLSQVSGTTDGDEFRSSWAKKSARRFTRPSSEDVLKMYGDDLVARIEGLGFADAREHLLNDTNALVRSTYTSYEEKIAFIKQINRLLDSSDKYSVEGAVNHVLALQLVRNAGQIEKIDQGDNGTCALQALEKRIIARHPGLLAEKIVDLALTNQFTINSSGKAVGIKPEWKYPNNLDIYAYPPLNEQRNYASHLATLVLANTRFETHNERYGTKLRYGQYDDRDALLDLSAGEPHLVYGLKGKNVDLRKFVTDDCFVRMRSPIKHPLVDVRALLDTYEAFTGEKASNILLQSYDSARTTGSFYQYLTSTEKVKDERALIYRNTAELKKHLSSAQRTGAYPLIFLQPGHATTVNSFDGESVAYDNQWGVENDVANLRVRHLEMLGNR